MGENLAITPGKVIWENELMQLIQYSPATETVHRRPLLIVPPWINKYYILDMRPKNSLVKYLVEQGHTVFMISWVNPDADLAEKTFEDYMRQGPLEAMDKVAEATGEDELNVTGYCLGGTLLAATLAWLAARGQSGRVASATWLTTLVDFAEAGELTVFIDDAQLQALEDKMAAQGYLEGTAMNTTFNLLRANDLIWSFVINNYLMGKEPFPFDLLYWNADSTAMPARVHRFYLDRFYNENAFAQGELTLFGRPVELSDIRVPVYHVASKEDHIAPAAAVYRGARRMTGAKEVRFVLAGSGHIAGVVNPPAMGKYQHWVDGDLGAEELPDWLATAEERPGSWWEDWSRWLSRRSGRKVEPREPGAKLGTLEEAPGSYVKRRFDEG